MWEPWHLTTLWSSMACYRDSFTFLPLAHSKKFRFRNNVFIHIHLFSKCCAKRNLDIIFMWWIMKIMYHETWLQTMHDSINSSVPIKNFHCNLFSSFGDVINRWADGHTHSLPIIVPFLCSMKRTNQSVTLSTESSKLLHISQFRV
jgi:hypothetical protein